MYTVSQNIVYSQARAVACGFDFVIAYKPPRPCFPQPMRVSAFAVVASHAQSSKGKVAGMWTSRST